MTRLQVDCTNANAQAVSRIVPGPQLVAWYGTGSPDIEWSAENRLLWPDAIHVEIDQGGAGSPVLTANVRDVENGAWTLNAALNRDGWNVPRPTIYCTRDTYRQLEGAGWKGDVWLAAPGTSLAQVEPWPGITVVAIQDYFGSQYDMSTVYDPYWPFNPPSGEDMISFTVDSGKYQFIPFPAGTIKGLMTFIEYQPDNDPAPIHLEIHSMAHGWSTHSFEYAQNTPLTTDMPFTDCDAVTVRNMSNVDNIGFTLH